MSKNPIIERKLLEAYYNEKNLPSKHNNKLDQLIGNKKWRKFKKQRKKKFPDFARTLKKISRSITATIQTDINESKKTLTTALSNIERINKKLNQKTPSLDNALRASTTDLIACEQILKKAKANTKLINKIISSSTTKSPQGSARNKL